MTEQYSCRPRSLLICSASFSHKRVEVTFRPKEFTVSYEDHFVTVFINKSKMLYDKFGDVVVQGDGLRMTLSHDDPMVEVFKTKFEPKQNVKSGRTSQTSSPHTGKPNTSYPESSPLRGRKMERKDHQSPGRSRSTSKSASTPSVISAGTVAYDSPFKRGRSNVVRSPATSPEPRANPLFSNVSSQPSEEQFESPSRNAHPADQTRYMENGDLIIDSDSDGEKKMKKSTGKKLTDRPPISALPPTSARKKRSSSSGIGGFFSPPLKVEAKTKQQSPYNIHGSGSKTIPPRTSSFMSAISAAGNRPPASGRDRNHLFSKSDGNSWADDDDVCLSAGPKRTTGSGDNGTEDAELRFDENGDVLPALPSVVKQSNTLNKYFGGGGKSFNDVLNDSIGRTSIAADRFYGSSSSASASASSSAAMAAHSERKYGLGALNWSKPFSGDGDNDDGGGAEGNSSSVPIKDRLRGGIRNMGNSCYMSAIVQAVLASDGFLQDLESPFWSRLPAFLKDQQMTATPPDTDNVGSSGGHAVISLDGSDATESTDTDKATKSPAADVATTADVVSASDFLTSHDKENIDTANLQLTPTATITTTATAAAIDEEWEQLPPELHSEMEESNETAGGAGAVPSAMTTAADSRYDQYSCLKEIVDISSRRRKLLRDGPVEYSRAFSSNFVLNNSLDISRLKTAINHHSAKFTGYRQQDAHEFLSDLMSALHEELGAGLHRYHQCATEYQAIMGGGETAATDSRYKEAAEEEVVVFSGDSATTIDQEEALFQAAIAASHNASSASDSVNSNGKAQKASGGVFSSPTSTTAVLSATTTAEKSDASQLSPAAASSSSSKRKAEVESDSHCTDGSATKKGRVDENGEDSSSSVALNIDALLPTTLHFESAVDVQFRCKCCGHLRPSKRETYRDFSLELLTDAQFRLSGPDLHSTPTVPADTLQLETLFDQFFTPEERELRCDECVKVHGDSGSKQSNSSGRPADYGKVEMVSTVRSLPDVLVLHLKRFRYDAHTDSFVKMNFPVAFPAELNSDNCAVVGSCAATSCDASTAATTKEVLRDLWRSNPETILLGEKAAQLTGLVRNGLKVQTAPAAVSDNIRTGFTDVKYQLRAVVRHIGQNAVAGHYICDVLERKSPATGTATPGSTSVASSRHTSPEVANKSAGGVSTTWLRYNDSTVTRISEDEVFGARDTPYIFFYARVQ